MLTTRLPACFKVQVDRMPSRHGTLQTVPAEAPVQSTVWPTVQAATLRAPVQAAALRPPVQATPVLQIA